ARSSIAAPIVAAAAGDASPWSTASDSLSFACESSSSALSRSPSSYLFCALSRACARSLAVWSSIAPDARASFTAAAAAAPAAPTPCAVGAVVRAGAGVGGGGGGGGGARGGGGRGGGRGRRAGGRPVAGVAGPLGLEPDRRAAPAAAQEREQHHGKHERNEARHHGRDHPPRAPGRGDVEPRLRADRGHDLGAVGGEG